MGGRGSEPDRTDVGVVRSNVLGFTCATNMPPPGREVQAERLGTLLAYRVRCKPLLESHAE